ncbi:Cellulose synthase-like protein D2 [Linum perenne]
MLRDANVMSDGRGLDILPCECDFKIFRDCYIDAMKTRGGIFQGCKESMALDVEELVEQLGLVPSSILFGSPWVVKLIAGAAVIVPVVNYWWHGFPSNLSREAHYY